MSANSKASPHVNGAAFDAKDPLNPSRALVPAVARVNEQRVTRGFWPKIRRVATKIPFAGDALSIWFCARDPATPAGAKAMMMAGLAYFVLPTDAIPDIFAGIGFTDDAAVIAAVLATLGAHVKRKHHDQAEAALKRVRDEAEA